MKPRPILSAIAHGIGACALVAIVGGAWMLLPFEPDAATALVTVALIGGFTWLAAVRMGPRRFAANDNDPKPIARLDWRPVDPDLTTVIPAQAGIQSQAKQMPVFRHSGS